MKAVVDGHVTGKLSKVKDITDEINQRCQVATSNDIQMATEIKNNYVYYMNYKKMKQHISHVMLLRTGNCKDSNILC